MELSVLNILAILASAVNTRMIFELTFSLIVKFFQMSLQCQFAITKKFDAFKNENLTGMHDQMTLKIRIPSENFLTFWAADDFVPMKQWRMLFQVITWKVSLIAKRTFEIPRGKMFIQMISHSPQNCRRWSANIALKSFSLFGLSAASCDDERTKGSKN